MRFALFILGLLVGASVAAQEQQPVKKKQVAKKQAAVKKAKAHQKPTPDQIRKFNELQKKQ